MAGHGRARCVPDRSVSDGNSGALTATSEHALAWVAAAPTAARRSLPSW